MALEVTEVLDVTIHGNGLGGFTLTRRRLEVPYSKDYDAIDPPLQWPIRFDLSNWQLFAAHIDGRRVGGAVVAFDTADVLMLEGRKDLAVLWDIRVSSDARRRGVGSALFRAAETWSRGRDCQQLKVETQNINVPACRLYASQGCTLGAMHRFAYPELPEEVQLLWYKNLDDHA
jgi:GNAT superfamily N-acetyltransferase